ncbi:DUF1016 N-terminal domain-containing protein [Sphingobacterium psychroaquaticum]|uniref:YhcG N-terminal domain-containing protein n=1 Tax=Sphingobacterium psychroaquaticum TaxID=561061 RepID=A0A1X7L954_9SPHI|nr:DUF1016 N-terminal domain-containing protein [Sphingobacterium psychroaquaticum]SMG50014.1 Protein of unknown function [Sphingobacterium psychroaquaticum]
MTNRFVEDIDTVLRSARMKALQEINSLMLTCIWEIGKQISLEKKHQNLDNECAAMEKIALTLTPIQDLLLNPENLRLYSRFYTLFPVFQRISLTLSWAHYLVLLEITDDLARAFYLKQAEKENWDVPTLETRINQSLFEKFVKSIDKAEFLQNLPKTNYAVIKAQPKLDTHQLAFLRFEDMSTDGPAHTQISST